MKQDYKTNRHSCYNLKYHLVVVTKYRHKAINEDVLSRLDEICKDILGNSWNCDILEFNGEDDHIHVLFEDPPQVQLSKLVNNFKTVSSRLIRKEFKEHIDNYFYNKPYFWSNSYLVLSTGGATIETIKHYIENQQSPSN